MNEALQDLSDSFEGIIAGFVLFFFAVALTWFVEKSAVRFSMLLKRAETATRTVVDSSRIDSRFDGRCVLVQGLSRASDSNACYDSETGFSVGVSGSTTALRLRRTVAMFQWVEHAREVEDRDGRKHTEYTYTKEWREIDSDSSQFAEGGGSGGGGGYGGGGGGYINDPYGQRVQMHHNPQRVPAIHSKIFDASVSIGAYNLTRAQVAKLGKFQPAPISGSQHFSTIHRCHGPSINTSATPHQLLYRPLTDALAQSDRAEPTVGLVRVSYEIIPQNGPITVVAVQTQNTFRPFTLRDGTTTVTSPPQQQQYNRISEYDSIERGYTEKTTAYGYENDNSIENEGGDERDCGSCACCLCFVCVFRCLDSCVGLTIGDDVLLVRECLADTHTMFDAEQKNFRSRLLLMRLLALLLFWISISLMLAPVALLLGWVPIVGGLAKSLFGAFTLILSVVVGSSVVAIAWISYHPEILGALMLSLGAAVWGWGYSEGSAASGAANTRVGMIFCALSLIPLAMAAYQRFEEMRYERGQRALDDSNFPPLTGQQRQQPAYNPHATGPVAYQV